jgi:hypothetical protein
MPDVDAQDLTPVFAEARRLAAGSVVVVTPGRLLMPVPAAPADALTDAERRKQKEMLGSGLALRICVVAHTDLRGLIAEDGMGKLKCIPFLASLCIFAAAGHNVVVFEGHPSALEAGLRDGDALFVDSAMVPFLQSEWLQVACRVMRDGAKQFICRREQQDMLAVAPSPDPPGWFYREPDGEASYANCLLTILARQPGVSVRLTTGKPVLELTPLAVGAYDIAWAKALPFRYDRLNATAVMSLIMQFAGSSLGGPRWIPGLRTQGPFRAVLAHEGGSLSVYFRVALWGFLMTKTLEVTREDF